MATKDHNPLISKLLHAASTLLMLFICGSATAQSGLYVPSNKPVRNMQKALTDPEAFYLLVQFDPAADAYTDAHLDLLDSAYRIAFSLTNPMLYTMTIESYGDADQQLATRRADAIYKYFAMRSHSTFPIRLVRNPIRCSCYGDTSEVLRYEVPVATAIYNCAELPSERLRLNKSVPLEGTVLVTFRNNPDECVGAARGCYVPRTDSTIYGYYSQLLLRRGSIYHVQNTKDTCPSGLVITLDDHLDYHDLIDQYHLIPHRKQLLVMAGYIVVRSQWQVPLSDCPQPQPDSITLRLPATQEQIDAKLRFYAKVHTARGVEYRALPTRKAPGKGLLALQTQLNAAQFDTIYLGKKIEEKELSKYFYPVADDTEASAFKVKGRYYVAARPDRSGTLQLKKPLQSLFRNIAEQEEDDTLPRGKSATPKGEEIIE